MFFVDVKFFIFWYINEVIILINLTLGGKMAAIKALLKHE
jgi:hypothetical protein